MINHPPPFQVYESKVLQESIIVGKEAAKQKVRVFVETSTAQIYEAGKVKVPIRFQSHSFHNSLSEIQIFIFVRTLESVQGGLVY